MTRKRSKFVCFVRNKKFAEKPRKERKDFFYKRFLCLGCASSSQHQVASCGNRLKCRICFGNHPTCLHVQKTLAESITNCTNVCTIPEQEGGSDHAMIVPVWVRQVDETSKEVMQYAVLDDQSNVRFVSQSLYEKLNLPSLSYTLPNENAALSYISSQMEPNSIGHFRRSPTGEICPFQIYIKCASMKKNELALSITTLVALVKIWKESCDILHILAWR